MEKTDPMSLRCGIVVFFGQKKAAEDAANNYLKDRDAKGEKVLVVYRDSCDDHFVLTERKPSSCSRQDTVAWALRHDPDVLAMPDLSLAPDMLVLAAESGLLAVTSSSLENEEAVREHLRRAGGLRDKDQERVLCIPA